MLWSTNAGMLLATGGIRLITLFFEKGCGGNMSHKMQWTTRSIQGGPQVRAVALAAFRAATTGGGKRPVWARQPGELHEWNPPEDASGILWVRGEVRPSNYRDHEGPEAALRVIAERGAPPPAAIYIAGHNGPSPSCGGLPEAFTAFWEMELSQEESDRIREDLVRNCGLTAEDADREVASRHRYTVAVVRAVPAVPPCWDRPDYQIGSREEELERVYMETLDELRKELYG